MKYQWILFDADETLFYFDAFKGLQRMFTQFKINFTLSDFEIYQRVNKPLWVDYQDGRITAAQLQHKRFEYWAKKLSVTTRQLNSAFLMAMADICTMLPGAEMLIKSLVGKVNMGIITNGFAELQTIRLQRTGLIEHFSPLVISEEVGVAKPHVDIFEHAFKQMNYPSKSTILMVGDNIHSDIQGGINAGIDTCWLNVAQAEKPADITPRYQIASLQELPPLLVKK